MTATTAPDPGLQLIAEGITGLLGFGVALINVRRGDELEVVAAAGTTRGSTPDGTHLAAGEMRGTRWPLSALLAELAGAEDWGLFKFVPHDRTSAEVAGLWVPDLEVSDDPEAWHPLDLLAAPILDDRGVLRGLLSIDAPDDGRRPGPAQRRMLERYAEQTRDAVLLTLERESLAERARDLELARSFLRRATGALGVEGILDEVGEVLMRGLAADGIRLHARDADGTMLFYGSRGMAWPPRAVPLELGVEVGGQAWHDGRWVVCDRDHVSDPQFAPHLDAVREILDLAGAQTMLFVPVGTDDEPLGFALLLRRAGRPAWSAGDGRLAMELGRDLGQVVQRSNAYVRERDLAQRLRAADQERSRLIDAVVRELRRPLADLDAGLAEVRRAERHSATWQHGLDRVTTSADRMVGMVDDLLLLSRLSDPATPRADARVELVSLLETVCHAQAARARDVIGTLEVPSGPAYVIGDRHELERALMHLMSNALAHTPPGGRVTLRLGQDGDTWVVTVADTGRGIPPEEQERVFTEFVRGPEPGAGLGLAIVRRVADRHGGRVELASSPGEGTEVRLVLPAAAPS